VSIHPSSVIAPGAVVPDSCTIGPFCTVGPEVVLGESCHLISHVVLDGRTRIGARNIIYPFASVGIAPQDLKYHGEPTETVVGDDNTIRESVTVSRGTTKGGGITRVGSGNLIMAYAHIAGHVIIEDYATVGAFSPVHQFCTVGRHAYIGGGTIVTQDVLPYSLTSARRENKAFGINKVGLSRRGFSPERLALLQKAYRLLLAAKMNTSDAIQKIKALEGPADAIEDVNILVDFIERSQRGVIK